MKISTLDMDEKPTTPFFGKRSIFDNPPEVLYELITYRKNEMVLELHNRNCPALSKVRSEFFHGFAKNFWKEMGHPPDDPLMSLGVGDLESMSTRADELVKTGEYHNWTKAKCCFK